MQEIAVVVSNNNQNITPIETITAIKGAGFQNVFIQWLDADWEYSQQQQLDFARQLGLNVLFVHLGWQNINSIWEAGDTGDKLVTRFIDDIKTCKENNIPMVIMHLTSGSEAPLYNEIGLNRIRQITDFAKENDIKVAFENMKIKGYLEYVLGNITDANVGICFDSGHCHAHFDDDFDFELYKNRIFAIHLHDNDQSGDQHLMPFDGTTDWQWVVKNLKARNYNGPITFELVYAGKYLAQSPLEFYKKGYEVGQKLLAMFNN